MKESKMTKIFKYIDKTPKLRNKQLITFICALNNRKYTSGYYSDPLSDLKKRGRIKVSKEGYYQLTKLGKDYINNPYAKTKQEKEQEKEIQQYYKIKRKLQMEQQQYENSKYNRIMKTINERGTIDTIEELTYFLKTFNRHDEIELSQDEEGNAFGKIFGEVFKDKIDRFTNKITLIPNIRH
jgi:predicted transposase YbfD/YdcC